MMPLLALALGIFFRLDPALLAGMVLVGSINGGQASNLCTYIAKGNVALSVLMTTATTLGAIFMTPVLCKSILGTVVPVDAAGIAISTIQVVLAPIAIGMTTNKVREGTKGTQRLGLDVIVNNLPFLFLSLSPPPRPPRSSSQTS